MFRTSSLWFIVITIIMATACGSRHGEEESADGQALDSLSLLVYQALPQVHQPPLEFDTATTAILRLDSSRTVLGEWAIASAALRQQDFAIIDSLFIVYVTTRNKKLAHDSIFRIDLQEMSYSKQLVPFINVKGEREVWVNVFCRKKGSYWKTRPVIVFDGGPCYFKLTINLDKGKISDSFPDFTPD